MTDDAPLPVPGGFLISSGPINPAITVSQTHEVIIGSVTIHPDGTVTYPPGTDLDDASLRFWAAITRNAPPITTPKATP